MLLGSLQVLLLLPEAIMNAIKSDACTSEGFLLIKILVDASLLSYVTIGQWIASRTLDLVSSRLIIANDSFIGGQRLFDKFSGMDLSFMVNQVF